MVSVFSVDLSGINKHMNISIIHYASHHSGQNIIPTQKYYTNLIEMSMLVYCRLDGKQQGNL